MLRNRKNQLGQNPMKRITRRKCVCVSSVQPRQKCSVFRHLATKLDCHLVNTKKYMRAPGDSKHVRNHVLPKEMRHLQELHMIKTSLWDSMRIVRAFWKNCTTQSLSSLVDLFSGISSPVVPSGNETRCYKHFLLLCTCSAIARGNNNFGIPFFFSTTAYCGDTDCETLKQDSIRRTAPKQSAIITPRASPKLFLCIDATHRSFTTHSTVHISSTWQQLYDKFGPVVVGITSLVELAPNIDERRITIGPCQGAANTT